MRQEKRPDTAREADLRRQVAELQEDKNQLEHDVDRLQQRKRQPPRHDPRPQGDSFDGGWMGW